MPADRIQPRIKPAADSARGQIAPNAQEQAIAAID
jgi:hypothetical protein